MRNRIQIAFVLIAALASLAALASSGRTDNGNKQSTSVRSSSSRTVTEALLNDTPSASEQVQKNRLGVKGYIGLVVGYVEPESPAAQAGLQRNDIITHMNGTQILGFQDILHISTSLDPGTVVELEYRRPIAQGQIFEAYKARVPLGAVTAQKSSDE